MVFKWNGSTWTTASADSPSYPLDTADDTTAQIQRTYAGAARLVYRANKRELSLTWDNIGTLAPQVYIRDMLTTGGTVNIAYADGTINAYPVPGSLKASETSYSLYSISATFAEI